MTNHAEMLISAIAHQRAGRAREAGALYRAVLAAEPDQPQALHLYGLLELGAGNAGRAAGWLHRAARLRPDHAGIHLALARARLNIAEPAEALAAAAAALALDDTVAEAHFLCGTALNALERPEAAISALERAVALQPAMAAAHLNLANAQADLDRLDLAEAACRRAIALDPAMAEAHASLGFILTGLGRLEAARAACEAAIALRPDFAQAHWNLATAALLAGDFDCGFREYEWRKRHDRFRHDFHALPGPVWKGEAPDGRTILVLAEQGNGDTIQLARYLPRIAAMGATVRLACAPSLIPLLRTLPGIDGVVAREGELPGHDLWIDQMSLPRAFGTRADSVPDADGYLEADPALVAAWRGRLPAGRKAGVVWAGNPAHSNDRRRSLPAEALGALLFVAGVRFVSLQCGKRAGDAGVHGLEDWSSMLTDYAQTAALIANLDLVVAVDTSVAHLAGALGKPVWLMLPFAPDWRWILGRDDTPWYRNMRLFRQAAPGDWSSVVEHVAAALGAMAQ